MTEFTIKLTTKERDLLRRVARDHFRHPRDQARYIIRQALGLTHEEQQRGSTGCGERLAASPTTGAELIAQ